MKSKTTAAVAQSGIIAAAYLAISSLIGPLAFYALQFRVSEALTIFPVFSRNSIYGLTIGCFLTNLLGVLTGANPIGVYDTVFGTAATLIAALLTRKLRNIRWFSLPILASLMPVVVNMVIIGIELCLAFHGGITLPLFLLYAGEVGLGQIGACMILGLPLCLIVEKYRLNRFLD